MNFFRRGVWPAAGRRDSWLAIVTLVAVISVFMFYAFVYVENKKNRLIDHRFQVLDQSGTTLTEIEKGFREVVKNAVSNTNLHISAQLLMTPFLSVDPLEQLECELKKRNAILLVGHGAPEARQDRFVFYDSADFPTSENPLGERFHIFSKGADLLSQLYRSDAFDHFLVAKEGKEKAFEIFFSTYPGDLFITQLGKLLDKDAGFESGSLKELELTKRKHLLFMLPRRFDSGEKFYIGGLLDSRRFTGESRSVASWTLIIFMIGFAALLICIPLIKLHLMSTFKTLGLDDVILADISIAAAGVVMSVIFLVGYHIMSQPALENRNLEQFSKHVQTDFLSDLEKLSLQLQEYDRQVAHIPLRKGDLVFRLLQHPNLQRAWDSELERPQLDNLLKPKKFPHFKNVFWMDRQGKQILQLSTRNYLGRLLELAHRDYFKKAGEWRLPEQLEKSFMLESIASVSSGEKLAALSILSGLQLADTGGDMDRSHVLAATSSLPSIIDPVVPEGFGFCIMDKSGDVWFHSDSRLNLHENVVRESGRDVTLQAALASGVPRTIEIHYHGSRHRFMLTPFEGFPLYLATFYNSELYDSSLIEAIRFAGVLIVILLFFNGALLFLFACRDYREYKKTSLTMGFDPFAWLRPVKINEEALRKCCSAIAISLPLLIGFRLLADQTASLFYCASASLILATISYTLLSKRLLRWNIFFLLGFYLVIVLTGWFSMSQRSFNLMLVFHLAMIVAIPIALRHPVRKPTRFENVYVMFFTIWQILVFIVPTIFFFQDGMNYERKNYWNFAQTRLSRELETRDHDIDLFFKEKIANEELGDRDMEFLETTKHLRQEAGIYADFLGLNTERKNLFGRSTQEDISANSSFDKLYYYLKSSRGPGGMLKKGLAYSPVALQVDIPPEQTGGPRTVHGLLLVLVFGGIIWAIFSLVRFAARKISGLDLITPESEFDFKRLLKERIRMKRNLALHSLTYHDLTRVRSLVEGKWQAELNIHMVDVEDQETLTAIDKSHRNPVWVDGLVLSPFDLTDATDKLKQIVRLLRIPGLQVIVSFTGTPLEDLPLAPGLAAEQKKEFLALIEEALQYLEIIPVPIEKTKENYDFRELLRNCNRMERFVLLDLVGDLLVNFNNRETVDSLWKRGLLVYDGTFNLMSPAFRNHILTATAPEDADALASSLRVEDKWMGFELPSFLLVLGGLVFLAFQQNLFQHVENFVALLAGVAVIIPRVTGVIDTIRSVTPKR